LKRSELSALMRTHGFAGVPDPDVRVQTSALGTSEDFYFAAVAGSDGYGPHFLLVPTERTQDQGPRADLHWYLVTGERDVDGSVQQFEDLREAVSHVRARSQVGEGVQQTANVDGPMACAMDELDAIVEGKFEAGEIVNWVYDRMLDILALARDAVEHR
jgi:hypothetical protein